MKAFLFRGDTTQDVRIRANKGFFTTSKHKHLAYLFKHIIPAYFPCLSEN